MEKKDSEDDRLWVLIFFPCLFSQLSIVNVYYFCNKHGFKILHTS